MVFSAKKRRNPFADRAARQRKAETQQRSERPPESDPEPVPAPEPTNTPVEPDQGCTCGPGEACSREDCKGTPIRASQPGSIDLSGGDADSEAGPYARTFTDEDWYTADPDAEHKPCFDINTGQVATDVSIASDSDEQVREAVTDHVGEPNRSRGRGRPRSQATIERNEAVLNRLRANPDGLTKAEIARAIGEQEQRVYASLRQLDADGHAERVRGGKSAQWVAASVDNRR